MVWNNTIWQKRAISVENLVETTWLTIYLKPTETNYDQGSKFISHEFRKYLIETEYRITAKTITLRNPTSNAILERIHQVLGNLVQNFNISETYVEKYDTWWGILAVAAFEIFSTTNRLRCYSLGQLVFGCDMILPIKHKSDWELIHQIKQKKIKEYNICKNSERVDHD